MTTHESKDVGPDVPFQSSSWVRPAHSLSAQSAASAFAALQMAALNGSQAQPESLVKAERDVGLVSTMVMLRTFVICQLIFNFTAYRFLTQL